MKLTKALESGRAFKLKGEPNYYTKFEGKVVGEGGKSRSVSAAEVDGNDWEVEPKEVRITRGDLESAMASVVPPVPSDVQAAVFERLGL